MSGEGGAGQIKLQLRVNVQAVMSGVRCLDSLPFITKSTQIAEQTMTSTFNFKFQTIVTIYTIIREYSHTHRPPHVVTTDP